MITNENLLPDEFKAKFFENESKVVDINALNGKIEIFYSNNIKVIYYNVPHVMVDALLQSDDPKDFVTSYLVNRFCFTKEHNSNTHAKWLEL